jgi:uncharacterized membrane protein YedE/YeeE
MMLEILRGPWPWYMAGPVIGLFVPLLLLVGNKPFGVSGSLRAICAAVAPGNVSFFRYDWRRSGAWSIAFVAGLLIGGLLAAALLGVDAPAIAPATRSALGALGLEEAVTDLAPTSLFSWSALLTLRGALFVAGGGFLVGFGASYAGGCTSGHGITGLAALQVASLIAVLAIFAGGLLTTYLLFPWIL